ncbi:sialate O-acetylesterase [Mangrovibacterium diazotrophicum]|uniref:Sialate O-acetylesterase n=1 Tax=Mangrovibacterium diazotrophicum TaxID=1261403 RepID=A0A419WA90_9BACT|nr:sialate O-acetylesterase [Mangrovibacterium diazotrophicum]RKD92377.1 sialate O-acetylesterase [Mangrovibacterium diazotrophicum]
MKLKGNKIWVLLIVLVSFSLSIQAAVKLPRLVSKGMVLQRDEPIKIWGWADAGERVNVEFRGESYKTKADKQGDWSVVLPASAAGGPYTLKVNEIELEDILIGDVWLCSGQSNMELPIRRVMDLYKDEISKVNNPQIRLFKVPMRYIFTDATTDYEGGDWKTATAENILDFSAVAYFFAADLYQKYRVPIGLISSAVGGSPAEAWLSETSLQKYPNYWASAQQCRSAAFVDSVKSADQNRIQNWHSELNQKDAGVNHWSTGDVDVSDWLENSLPGYWSEQNIDFKNGSVWFCKEFELTDNLAAKDAVLRLGRIIDADSAFVNGTFVGTISYQYPPRIYQVPASVLKSGKNQLMVRVISQSGRGGFMPDKPYALRFLNDTIDLTGEWHYHIGAEMPQLESQTFFQYTPGGLYKGMINPALNYTLKGVIWYQGESNTDRPGEYRQLFGDLIQDWRTQFQRPELPFLFVQLANLGEPQKLPSESNWAELRDAQRRTLELPKTGMAVIYDIGEWNDIHPLNKKDVGHRLSLQAQSVAYGDSDVVSSGPLYQSMKIENGSIVLTFISVGSDLFTNSLLQGFQIAGEDGRFEWAHAVVLDKNTVKVWSENIQNPRTVRYGWANNPADANLKNKEGLPASPFTTNNE